MAQGWGRPIGGRKWHYFEEGKNTALCSRATVLKAEVLGLADEGHDLEDNCAECKRRLLKKYPGKAGQ